MIYGDYDVDGVCGTSILWSCLRLAGLSRRRLLHPPPGRGRLRGQRRGPASTRRRESRPTLVVTVDCGISAVAEAELARELGLEFIITDHHTIGDDLPEADVIVHPRLAGSRYPCGDLCGAGVAFKLAWQICKGFGDGKKASPHLRDYLVRSLGLVALATVADVVPLSRREPHLVRHGLAGSRPTRASGMRALMRGQRLPRARRS